MQTLFPRTHTKYRMAVGLGILFVLVVSVVTYVVTARQQPKYLASLSIAVNRIGQKNTPTYYQYDGYYAIQASDLFSQTLLSWFLTPSVLLEFYTKANIDPHITSLGQLSSRFRARKFSAQNIVVQFTEQDRTTAEKLAGAIADVVQTRGNALDVDPEGSGTFDVVPAQPVIVQTKPDAVLNTIAALIGSTLVAAAVIAGRRYMSA